MNRHLYEGTPDSRQGDADTVTSRFRPKYRALSDREKALHDGIKDWAAGMEAKFNEVSSLNSASGREIALAMTKLEESVMWAVKGLTK